MNQEPIGPLYSIKEAASLLKCSRFKIQKAIQSEALKAFRCGHSYRLSLDQLKEYMKPTIPPQDQEHPEAV